MHEWYITEELLDQVCTQAKENRISKITKIQVELGEDSHITVDSLRLCFQLLSEKNDSQGSSIGNRALSGEWFDTGIV